MYQLIIAIHVLLGLGIIGLVLMQQGRGADAGAAFGSGSSGSVFGARGAASFLSRTTAIFATLFFITSLGLAYLSGKTGQTTDIMQDVKIEEKTAKPNADLPPVAPAVNDTANPAPAATPAPASTPAAVTPPAAAPEATEAPAAAVPAPTATPAATPSDSLPAAPVEPVKPTTETPAPAAAAPNSAVFEDTLPTGVTLKAATDGVESKLVALIKDTNRAVDKNSWFTMDGITFDTSKAAVKEGSKAQLNNVAEIMKAFPAVKIKIGGYTDNAGKAAANKKLSAERANAIKKALVGLGIESARLEAEGYGSEHPVASNDTDTGRQQNRRIDVNVLSK